MSEKTGIKTVKFEALKGLREAEQFLISAQQKLAEVMALEGDNEAQIFAEALLISVGKDRMLLCRGIKEAEENW